MPRFVWKGKNRYGDLVGGERVARSAEDILNSLKREQITDISISKKRTEINIPFLQNRGVKVKDISIYSRQLSVLVDADLPLMQSLNILAEQAKNKYFKRVIKDIRDDVEGGSTLHQAKKKFPNIFDNLYCNLVASGEHSGTLDIMLKRLAEYFEKIVKLRSQIRQATVYPLAILIFAVLVIVFMMWKVIPVFSKIFLELGAELPPLTTAILAISGFVQKKRIPCPNDQKQTKQYQLPSVTVGVFALPLFHSHPLHRENRGRGRPLFLVLTHSVAKPFNDLGLLVLIKDVIELYKKVQVL